jgi:DNA-binding PadR family transcriptional regulator
LLDLNWIERVSLGDVKHPGRRRKVYRLSGRGHQAIEIEVQRMGRLIKTVRQRLGLQLP